jgi:Ca2+/Na+ antiporter
MLQVVAVLNGAGAILGIEEDLLGATVLAWGETLPDLVAMLAVARAGTSQHLNPVGLC